jgi:hypothetical protein
MTHEEVIVRSAYAKLSYAIEQGVVSDFAMEEGGVPTKTALTHEQRMTDAQLTVTLDDFKIGDASEILNRKATDLITPATDQATEVDERTMSYQYGGNMYTWYAPGIHWSPARPLPEN